MFRFRFIVLHYFLIFDHFLVIAPFFLGITMVNCCMPGCTNCFRKTTTFISYFSFPTAGVSSAIDEWRRQLIVAVARADSVFNPETHKICSVHFEKECLLSHGEWHQSTNESINQSITQLYSYTEYNKYYYTIVIK